MTRAINRSPGVILPVAQVSRMIERAAEIYGVEPSDVTGPRRFAHLVRPRYAVAHALRRRRVSYGEIGRHLGGRDHHTIIYAVNQAKNYAKREPGYGVVLGEVARAGK